MLRPIPSRILTHNAVLKWVSSVDVWQTPTFTEIELEHICIQPTHETRMNRDNTEVALNSIAFIDARLSQPQGFDFYAAQETSEANGLPMALEYNGHTYTVITVDALIDDTGAYHHTELGLM